MTKFDVIFSKLFITLFLLVLLLKGHKLPYENQVVHAQEYIPSLVAVQPEYLYISKLNISLPISVSKIVNDEWIISDEISAFYGEGSSFPGFDGTTVVFAHARNGLFVDLPTLEVGNAIVLYTKNDVFIYKVTHKKLILPDEVDFLSHEGHNKLAIFTCYGFADEYRIVFFADFIEKQQIEERNSVLYHI